MDIENLTIKQARELVSMFSAATPAKPQPLLSDPFPVIVCTDKRGVVFGYTTDTSGDKITLTNARMCLYWSTDVGGVFGLAEKGPTKDCKISAVAPAITLAEITAVFSVDDAAVKAWVKAPVQGR